MTLGGHIERRRFTRLQMNGHAVRSVHSTPVRVVDISLDGVLLAAQQAIPVRMASLRLPLGDRHFASEVMLRYEQPWSGETRRLGASFVEMSAESRRALEEFLSRAAR